MEHPSAVEDPGGKGATRIFLPAILALGAAGQIGQVLLLRELLMVFHGNELSFGFILAAWLFWVAVGSAIATRPAANTDRPVQRAGWLVLGFTIAMPTTLAAVRLLRGIFNLPPGAYLGIQDIALACLVIPAPLCMLLGAQFVFLARAWRLVSGGVDCSWKMYSGEALGTIGGGLGFSLLLVHIAGSFHAVVVALLPLLAISFLLQRRVHADHHDHHPQGTSSRGGHPLDNLLPMALAAMLLGILLALPFLTTIDRLSHAAQWRQAAPEYQLEAIRDSRYGTIAVASRAGQFSFFQSGNLAFTLAGEEQSAVLEEEQSVVLAHLALLQHPQPQEVLLIGGGLGGSLREILRHPVKTLDYVELDEGLVALARSRAPAGTSAALDDPRVRVVHGDGRLFLKHSLQDYDLIIVDLPEPATTVLNRFYTVEFFREAAARLGTAGVLVLSLPSTPDLRASAIANRNATIWHSLQLVFPKLLVIGERRLLYFATGADAALVTDPAVLATRLTDRALQGSDFQPGRLYSLLLEDRLRRVSWILRNHGRSGTAHLEPPATGPLFPPGISEQAAADHHLPPVYQPYFINRDFRPIAVMHTLMFWSVHARAGQGELLRMLLRIDVQRFWPLLVLILVIGLGLRLRDGRQGRSTQAKGYAVIVAVVTTGLSTMAMQLALLMAFQSVYGFVYEMAGLITALFMAGLAGGTALGRRLSGGRANYRMLACLQLGIALFAVLIGVALPATAGLTRPVGVFVLFGLATILSGLLNGLDFPLATACLTDLGGNPDRALGSVYALELFGACSGALLAGLVVIPVHGIVAGFLLAGIGNTVAALVLFLCGWGGENGHQTAA
jgi:spermidine synthase